MSWRSPSMLPPPVDAGAFRRAGPARARLALGGAWRLRALAHAMSHALRRVPGGEPAWQVVRRAEAALAASDAFLEAAAALGVEDVETQVQARLRGEPLPWPESWADAAVADALLGGALELGVASLRASSEPALARAAAASGLDGTAFGAGVVAALAADVPSRACLTILVDRWAPASVHALGRPGTAADAELVEARVKPDSSATLVRRHLDAAEARLAPHGLALPDAARMGVDVPDAWTPTRSARR